MAEDKSPDKILQPKNPNFKIITRGPRKGQMVRTTRRERAERVRQNIAELNAERAATRVAISSQKTEDANTETASRSHFGGEVLLAFVIVFVLWGMSTAVIYAIGLGLRALRLGSLFIPLVFVDFVLWRNLSRPKRNSKYLPFIWWF